MPFYEELESKLTVDVPQEGYFIQPADQDWLLPKLQVHNIKYSLWKNSPAKTLKIFRATKTKLSPNSFEGHQTLMVEGEWKEEEVILPQYMIFVPINQSKARLILQLFEPKSQDSFLAWGFFNLAFERKEYMEDYVTEDVAIAMLKTPKIKSEFENQLQDEQFAKSPKNRFEFFYKKHPSWDDRFNRYPVFKN